MTARQELWAETGEPGVKFRRFARRAGLPDRIVVAAARDTTDRLRDAWRTHPATDLLPRFIRDAVSAHLDRGPLGR